MRFSLKSLLPSFGQWSFSNLYNPRKIGGSYFYPLSANVWKDVKCLEAFATIPELNAIINILARAHSNARYKVVNSVGKEKPNDSINKLLKKPNYFQSQKEFIYQSELFHNIFGNEYLYTLTRIGGTPNVTAIPELGTQAMFTLPPNLVRAQYLDERPFFDFQGGNDMPTIKYEYNNNGTWKDLRSELIVHLTDNRVDVKKMNAKDLLEGETKIKALTVNLNNIKMAYETRGVILKHRGAMGILSNTTLDVSGTVPVNPDEIERINKEYMNNYGGLEGQSGIIITSSALKWQQMAVNPDKLGLFQETEEDTNKCLDAYGVPMELLTRSKGGATFENQKQARKGMYQETVMPKAEERAQALNDQLMQDSNFTIIPDFSHLPIFQDDIKHRAEAINAMVNYLSVLLQDGQITNDEYREELAKVGVGNGKAIVVEKPADAPAKPESEGEGEETDNEDENETK